MFYYVDLKAAQWTAYSSSIDLAGLSLDVVVHAIWSYLGPACERLVKL